MPVLQWEEKEERLHLNFVEGRPLDWPNGECFKLDSYKVCVGWKKPIYPHVNVDRLNSERVSWKAK